MLTIFDYENNAICILRSSITRYIDGEAYNITYSAELSGLKEISMIVPLYVIDNNEQVENHRWSWIIPEYKVRYIDTEGNEDWYFISSLEEIFSTDGKLLSNLNLKHISFKLNKAGMNKTIDMVDTPDNILDEILSGTSWSRGTISASILAKTRSLVIDNKISTMGQIQELAEKLDCYIRFNGNKTIDLLESIGQDLGVQIRIGKNLKGIRKVSESTDLITRLYFYGTETDDGIVSISDSSPFLEPYSQDFSYYIDNGIMSSGKAALIPTYESDILSVNTNINNTLSTINTQTSAKNAKQAVTQLKRLNVLSINGLVDENTRKLALLVTGSSGYTNVSNEITKHNNMISLFTTGTSSLSLTGTLNVTSGGIIVTGSSTFFINEGLMKFDQLHLDGTTYTISEVTSDSSLTVSTAFVSSGAFSCSATVKGYLSLDGEIAACDVILASAAINLAAYQASKTNTMNTFATAMGDFLQIGIINDSSYIYASSMYVDCTSTLSRLSQPQVSFSMQFVDLARLLPNDYSLEYVHLGDNLHCWVDLLRFETTLNVTKLSYVIDKPFDEATIEVSNYVTNFNDLFKNISRSSDYLIEKKHNIIRSENALTASGNIVTSALQNTFNNSTVEIPFGSNNSGNVGSGGMKFVSSKNPNHILRVNGANMDVSLDNEATWNNLITIYDDISTSGVVTPKVGFNMNYARGGVLNIAELNLLGATGSSFFWNELGLFAKDSVDPANKWIRYNSDGLISTITGTSSNPKFALYASGSLSLEGNITAASGNIGGWTISTSTLYNGTDALLDSSNYKVSFNNGKAIYGQYATGKYGMKADALVINATDLQMYVGTSYTGASTKINLSNGQFFTKDVIIQNTSGTTMITSTGIIQSWGDSIVDNVDATHKLKLKFYVPTEMLSIKKVLLNFSLEAFRAYETGAASGGSSSPTSAADGDHRHQMMTTTGNPLSDDTVDVLKSPSGVSTVHTAKASRYQIIAGDSSGGNGATLYIESPGGSMNMYTKGASGTHTHDVAIPEHLHDITYGIYESTSATGVKVYVDGTLRLDNGGAGYTTEQANLDLSTWITTSGWHYIELSSTQLGRISAAYFLQVFLSV